MSEELEKKQDAQIATSRRGHEQAVDQSDLTIPRAMLIQFTPPKTINIDPETTPPGSIINSVTGEKLTKDETGAIQFIPVMRAVEWIRFNSQNDKDTDFNPGYEPGAIIWRSNDPKDPRVIEEGAWGANNEPPRATKFINYLAVVPDQSMPIIVSFAKTSFKAGKVMTTMTQFAAGDLFSWKYRLRTKKEQNDQKQQYYILTVERAGKCSPEEFSQAEAIYNAFAGKDIKIHEETDEDSSPKEKQPWE